MQTGSFRLETKLRNTLTLRSAENEKDNVVYTPNNCYCLDLLRHGLDDDLVMLRKESQTARKGGGK